MRFIDAETQPGQRMICMFVNAQINISRQSRRTDGRQHSVTKIGKRIEYRGNKHIAGNSADCVEMNMHKNYPLAQWAYAPTAANLKPGASSRSRGRVLALRRQHRIEVAL